MGKEVLLWSVLVLYCVLVYLTLRQINRVKDQQLVISLR